MVQKQRTTGIMLVMFSLGAAIVIFAVSNVVLAAAYISTEPNYFDYNGFMWVHSVMASLLSFVGFLLMSFARERLKHSTVGDERASQ